MGHCDSYGLLGLFSVYIIKMHIHCWILRRFFASQVNKVLTNILVESSACIHRPKYWLINFPYMTPGIFLSFGKLINISLSVGTDCRKALVTSSDLISQPFLAATMSKMLIFCFLTAFLLTLVQLWLLARLKILQLPACNSVVSLTQLVSPSVALIVKLVVN